MGRKDHGPIARQLRQQPIEAQPLLGVESGGWLVHDQQSRITGDGLRTARGDLRQTRNATDLAIDGEGYFVLRDQDGVPHLFAADMPDLLRAMGYVHAQDRFFQMELARRMGEGRVAEILGPEAIDHDRPTCFIAYTIKGWGTPLAGHKDNHAGVMNTAQFASFRAGMKVSEGREWDRFCAIGDPSGLEEFLSAVPFFASGTRRHRAARMATPGPVFLDEREISTQAGFGKILDLLAQSGHPLVDRIMTTSPDVTVSTNLGPWVNRRGLFARDAMADTFLAERVPSAQKWSFSPSGQHIELGIAEMNLFLLLAAAGLSHALFGERLLPVGTVYDPFVLRGLDALNYACYQDARFILAGTPSGVSLAPEGGAHQSLATPLIGIAQDGLCAFEPAFVDELSVILDWAFDYLQRDGEGDPDERTWLRDETGGSVYLRLTTRPLEQPKRRDDEAFRRGVIDGAYWLREPGPGAEIVLAYQGAVAPEVIAAAGRLGALRRDIGVLAVTSADRLNAGWTAAQRARRRGHAGARGHVERLLGDLPRHCVLVTVTDGHPATLAWLGGVAGHRTLPLGVEHFGQTGTIADLYRHYGIDSQTIASFATALTPGPRS